MRVSAAVAIVAIAVAVPACTLLMDLNRFSEAVAVADAGPDAGVGSGEAGPWECLSQPGETLDPTATVALSLLLYDPTQSFTIASAAVDGGSDLEVVAYTALTGVSVSQCPLFNSCATPTAHQTTDDAGVAEFNLSGSFNGFFRMTRPDLIPSTFYPGQLLTGQATVTEATVMLSPDVAAGLGSSLGVPIALDPDGGLGNAIFTIFDCNDRHGSGVVFTLSSISTDTLLYYVKDGLPTTQATQTTSYGTGGANNVPVGNLTVTATLVETQKPLGSASVVIRPGEYSYLWIRARTH